MKLLFGAVFLICFNACYGIAINPISVKTKANSPCPRGWYYAIDLDQCYFIPDLFLSFSSARDYCANDVGGSLVSIYDPVEYYGVSFYLEQQSFAMTQSAWIGLRTYPYVPFFRWLDGHNANYTRWINGTTPSHSNANACFAWSKSKGNDGWFISDCNVQRPFVCKRHAATCPDINVSGSNGTITSPNYQAPYDLDVTCVYHISVPRGNIVRLSFDLVVIDPYSLITIFDGPATNGSILELISSAAFSNIVESTSNAITVQFFASNLGGAVFAGWTATYQAIQPVALEGQLTSPNYPNGYNDNDCETYEINVPFGYRVLVTIQYFESEENNDIFLISDETGILINWSGIYKKTPHYVRSHNNTMHIEWRTNDNLRYNGWNLTWVADPIWG